MPVGAGGPPGFTFADEGAPFLAGQVAPRSRAKLLDGPFWIGRPDFYVIVADGQKRLAVGREMRFADGLAVLKPADRSPGSRLGHQSGTVLA